MLTPVPKSPCINSVNLIYHTILGIMTIIYVQSLSAPANPGMVNSNIFNLRAVWFPAVPAVLYLLIAFISLLPEVLVHGSPLSPSPAVPAVLYLLCLPCPLIAFISLLPAVLRSCSPVSPCLPYPPYRLYLLLPAVPAVLRSVSPSPAVPAVPAVLYLLCLLIPYRLSLLLSLRSCISFVSLISYRPFLP